MRVLKTNMFIAVSVVATSMAGCDVMVSGRNHHDREYVAVQAQPVYVEPQPQYVIVQQAPPPMIVESRPLLPSGLHVWIDGSWNWSNQRYNWQPGRYELPPRHGSVWVAARYDHDEHGYRYTPGQWR